MCLEVGSVFFFFLTCFLCVCSRFCTGRYTIELWLTTSFLISLSRSLVRSFFLQAYVAISDFFRELWGARAGWAHSVLFTAELASFADLVASAPNVAVAAAPTSAATARQEERAAEKEENGAEEAEESGTEDSSSSESESEEETARAGRKRKREKRSKKGAARQNASVRSKRAKRS